jgi:hypothetical protein
MRDSWDDDEPPVLPAHKGLPPEAQRLGLTRNTEEGALLEFAAALDNAKPAHRFAAWLMLLAFVAPALLTLLITIF